MSFAFFNVKYFLHVISMQLVFSVIQDFVYFNEFWTLTTLFNVIKRSVY